jgi:hypothetical protein
MLAQSLSLAHFPLSIATMLFATPKGQAKFKSPELTYWSIKRGGLDSRGLTCLTKTTQKQCPMCGSIREVLLHGRPACISGFEAT